MFEPTSTATSTAKEPTQEQLKAFKKIYLSEKYNKYQQKANEQELMEKQLEEYLKLFGGHKMNPESKLQLTDYQQKFGMKFFSNIDLVSDPRINVTALVDITKIKQVYEKYYRKTEGFATKDNTTFTAYLTHKFLQTMEGTALNYRNILGNWYEFTNLPLIVMKKVGDHDVKNLQSDDLELHVVRDVANLSWEAFYPKFNRIRKGDKADVLTKTEETTTGIRLIDLGNFIQNVAIKNMTSYTPTEKIKQWHQPIICFSFNTPLLSDISQRSILSVNMKYPHSTLTAESFDHFIARFVALAEKQPLLLQQLKISEEEEEIKLEQQPQLA